MPKSSKKKRIKVLTRRVKWWAVAFDDLSAAFESMEDTEPIRAVLITELGEGSGSGARDGMNTLELVELLARKYRRSETASRQWQNRAADQAELLTKIKSSLLEACLRPNERLSPLELADGMAPMVQVLRDMLEDCRATLRQERAENPPSARQKDVTIALAHLEEVLTPDQAKVFAESGVSIQGYAQFVASQLKSARSTIKDLNRVDDIVRTMITDALPSIWKSNGYLPKMVEKLVALYQSRGEAFKEQREMFRRQRAFLGERIAELTIAPDVLDKAHRLVGAAGDEVLSNQDLINSLIRRIENTEAPPRDQPPTPPADPALDSTAIPG